MNMNPITFFFFSPDHVHLLAKNDIDKHAIASADALPLHQIAKSGDLAKNKSSGDYFGII